MKNKIHKNIFAAIVAMVIALFATPQKAQAQDLYFGGLEVTQSNCNDLIAAFKNHFTQVGIFGGEYCKASGKVTFDFTTNTLTLDNANITLNLNPGSLDGVVFNSSRDMLRVNLIGNNVINSGTAAFHQARRNGGADPSMTFTGTGTLTINNRGGNRSRYAAINIYVDGKMYVQCKELKVHTNFGTAIGALYGYESNGRSTLSIGSNAALIAKGRAGSIAKLNNFSMGSGYKFHTPSGARWDSRESAVCDGSGNVITDEVICAPKDWHPSTGIDNPIVNTPLTPSPKCGTYTLQGIRLTTEFSRLPRGVYIVDGKKVIKK